MYQVGVLTNPEKADIIFSDRFDAIWHARQVSKADTNLPLAVWDDDCNVERLFLCGQEFVPVPT